MILFKEKQDSNIKSICFLFSFLFKYTKTEKVNSFAYRIYNQINKNKSRCVIIKGRKLKEKIKKKTYNRIRNIFILLAHNPWDTCREPFCHLSCPFCVCLPWCSYLPLYWSILILYLPIFKKYHYYIYLECIRCESCII